MMPKTGGHGGPDHSKATISDSVQFGGDGYLYVGDRLVPKPAARMHLKCTEGLCLPPAESESEPQED